VATADLDIGSIILKKILTILAPSIFADSRIPSGIAIKKFLNK